MTDTCCRRVKQIQATIVRYNKPPNRSPNGAPQLPSESTCIQAAQEGVEFQERVIKLKRRLDEANANIALLRSWVGETGETLKEAAPKTPQDTINHIKNLIVKLDDLESHVETLVKRGQESMENLETIENQGCFCAQGTESCEEIKKQLIEVAEEKKTLDSAIDQMKEGYEQPGSAPPQEMVDAIRDEMSEVKGCVDWTCPRLNDGQPKIATVMETGVQNKVDEPITRPKLSQTDKNPQWNQGTMPLCEMSKCCKSVNTY